ncbi:hypothetical protein H8E88_19380 [candidate division KSB1 bacterium]|nr:hypothetical protein [candidate division KSB1 bacterium]
MAKEFQPGPPEPEYEQIPWYNTLPTASAWLLQTVMIAITLGILIGGVLHIEKLVKKNTALIAKQQIILDNIEEWTVPVE